MEEELHIWLVSLTRNMTVSAAETLVYRIGDLSDKDDRMNASAVLDLAINANPKLFDVIKEETPMFEELQKLMKPHIDAAVNTTKIDGIDTCRKKLGLSLEEACETFEMSVDEYQKIKASLAPDSKAEDSGDKVENPNNADSNE